MLHVPPAPFAVTPTCSDVFFTTQPCPSPYIGCMSCPSCRELGRGRWTPTCILQLGVSPSNSTAAVRRDERPKMFLRLDLDDDGNGAAARRWNRPKIADEPASTAQPPRARSGGSTRGRGEERRAEARGEVRVREKRPNYLLPLCYKKKIFLPLIYKKYIFSPLSYIPPVKKKIPAANFIPP